MMAIHFLAMTLMFIAAFYGPTTVEYFGRLEAKRYLTGSQTFGERYKINPEGLKLWLNQADVRSYGTTQDWKSLTGGADSGVEQVTGVNQPDIYATYRTFNGTTDFMQKVEVDSEQGALTFIADGGSAEFRDAGQDFSEWETLSGNAKYRLVVNTDNGISYCYAGASNNGGLDIDCYTDLGLTSRGWKGRTTPQASPDTAATYEIYRTDLAITGDMTVIMWIKPDDGHPVNSNTLFSKWDTAVSNFRGFLLWQLNDGKLRLYISSNGILNPYEQTNDPVFSDGAQSAFTLITSVYDSSAQTVTFYANGVVIASTTTGTITSLFDSVVPFQVGALGVAATFFYTGQIGAVMVFNRVLSAAEIQRIYLEDLPRFLVSWLDWKFMMVSVMVIAFLSFVFLRFHYNNRNYM